MMTMDIAGDIMASGIRLVLLISVVAIIPSLLVGLCVSIFQATTQINEQTLSFLPRLVMTLLVLILVGNGCSPSFQILLSTSSIKLQRWLDKSPWALIFSH